MTVVFIRNGHRFPNLLRGTASVEACNEIAGNEEHFMQLPQAALGGGLSLRKRRQHRSSGTSYTQPELVIVVIRA